MNMINYLLNSSIRPASASVAGGMNLVSRAIVGLKTDGLRAHYKSLFGIGLGVSASVLACVSNFGQDHTTAGAILTSNQGMAQIAPTLFAQNAVDRTAPVSIAKFEAEMRRKFPNDNEIVVKKGDQLAHVAGMAAISTDQLPAAAILGTVQHVGSPNSPFIRAGQTRATDQVAELGASPSSPVMILTTVRPKTKQISADKLVIAKGADENTDAAHKVKFKVTLASGHDVLPSRKVVEVRNGAETQRFLTSEERPTDLALRQKDYVASFITQQVVDATTEQNVPIEGTFDAPAQVVAVSMPDRYITSAHGAKPVALVADHTSETDDFLTTIGNEVSSSAQVFTAAQVAPLLSDACREESTRATKLVSELVEVEEGLKELKAGLNGDQSSAAHYDHVKDDVAKIKAKAVQATRYATDHQQWYNSAARQQLSAGEIRTHQSFTACSAPTSSVANGGTNARQDPSDIVAVRGATPVHTASALIVAPRRQYVAPEGLVTDAGLQNAELASARRYVKVQPHDALQTVQRSAKIDTNVLRKSNAVPHVLKAAVLPDTGVAADTNVDLAVQCNSYTNVQSCKTQAMGWVEHTSKLKKPTGPKMAAGTTVRTVAVLPDAQANAVMNSAKLRVPVSNINPDGTAEASLKWDTNLLSSGRSSFEAASGENSVYIKLDTMSPSGTVKRDLRPPAIKDLLANLKKNSVSATVAENVQLLKAVGQGKLATLLENLPPDESRYSPAEHALKKQVRAIATFIRDNAQTVGEGHIHGNNDDYGRMPALTKIRLPAIRDADTSHYTVDTAEASHGALEGSKHTQLITVASADNVLNGAFQAGKHLVANKGNVVKASQTHAPIIARTRALDKNSAPAQRIKFCLQNLVHWDSTWFEAYNDGGQVVIIAKRDATVKQFVDSVLPKLKEIVGHVNSRNSMFGGRRPTARANPMQLSSMINTLIGVLNASRPDASTIPFWSTSSSTATWSEWFTAGMNGAWAALPFARTAVFFGGIYATVKGLDEIGRDRKVSASPALQTLSAASAAPAAADARPAAAAAAATPTVFTTDDVAPASASAPAPAQVDRPADRPASTRERTLARPATDSASDAQSKPTYFARAKSAVYKGTEKVKSGVKRTTYFFAADKFWQRTLAEDRVKVKKAAKCMTFTLSTAGMSMAVLAALVKSDISPAITKAIMDLYESISRAVR